MNKQNITFKIKDTLFNIICDDYIYFLLKKIDNKHFIKTKIKNAVNIEFIPGLKFNRRRQTILRQEKNKITLITSASKIIYFRKKKHITIYYTCNYFIPQILSLSFILCLQIYFLYNNKDLFFLDTNVLKFKRKYIFISGVSGAGKSSLSFFLQKNGFLFISDNYILYDNFTKTFISLSLPIFKEKTIYKTNKVNLIKIAKNKIFKFNKKSFAFKPDNVILFHIIGWRKNKIIPLNKKDLFQILIKLNLCFLIKYKIAKKHQLNNILESLSTLSYNIKSYALYHNKNKYNELLLLLKNNI